MRIWTVLVGLFEFFFNKKIKNIQRNTANLVINNIKKSAPKNYYQMNGNYSPGYSGGSKFAYGLNCSGSGMSFDHTKLLQNARKAVFDSIQAKALVDRFAETTIDIGLKLEALPASKILGITTEEAEEWGRNVSERFDMWSKSKKQHRAGQFNFYQAQLMYGKFQQRDNDIFTRLFYSKKRDLLNPLQFEFVDPMQIRGYAYTNTSYQYNYEDGIIRNSDGTEKAYKVWLQKPGTFEFKDFEIPAKGIKSGKTMMLHGFQPEYAQQGRGYSRLGHALQEFQNITDFQSSTIKKAINQSSLVFSIENQQQDPSDGGIENLLSNKGAGPVIEQPQVENIPATVSDNGNNFTYNNIPEMTVTDPGSVGMIGLAQGDTLRMHPTKAQGDSYEEFLNTFVSYLSASMGMPIEVMLMKFNSNYSASRASLVLFWRIAQIWRNEMTADWNNPIYKAWLGEEIAAGRITARGWSDPILKAAWLKNIWIGAPMPNIDPMKEAKASKEYLDMSATTQKTIARNLNGSDATDNIAINKRFFEETPVPPWNNSGGQEPAGEEEKEEEEKEEEK